MAGPIPELGVARYPTVFQSHGECLASGTCLGSTGEQPARCRNRHAPELSYEWRDGWRIDKHSAASPHRTPRSPWLTRFRCPLACPSNHRSKSRRKVAQAAALSVGQFTLMVPRGGWISTQIFDDVACEFAPASGMGNGINAGCSAVLFCACTRIHLWTRFALRLWLNAMLAIEAPGWTHS